MRMANVRRLAVITLLCGSLGPQFVLAAAAQTSPPPDKPKAASTRSERAAAQAARRKQMIERDAAVREKRTRCLQERKEKKIPILERPRFIRDCMAR